MLLASFAYLSLPIDRFLQITVSPSHFVVVSRTVFTHETPATARGDERVLATSTVTTLSPPAAIQAILKPVPIWMGSLVRVMRMQSVGLDLMDGSRTGKL